MGNGSVTVETVNSSEAGEYDEYMPGVVRDRDDDSNPQPRDEVLRQRTEDDEDEYANNSLAGLTTANTLSSTVHTNSPRMATPTPPPPQAAPVNELG